jgi:deoxyadenosine/deoxycytidine kinase
MSSSSTVQIISIEGNIGSGKSTLLANLKENCPNVVFLKEPVDEWEKIRDENGTTMLEKFYADQTKYSFSFQMMAYISRLKILRDTIRNHPERPITIITERSLNTDKMVFAKMLYDSGKIEHINYQIYLSWFDTFSAEYPVQKHIYVKTDPEICHKRIHIRSRNGEDNIPIDYLVSCSEYHDDMMEVVEGDKLVLDGNVDIYENTEVLSEWIDTIRRFIGE